MTDISRPTRPRLSVTRNAETCADARQARSTTIRRHDNENGRRTADHSSSGAQSDGSRQVIAIADFLDPVCTHFNLEDDSAAELAAFARKMLSGHSLRGTHIMRS